MKRRHQLAFAGERDRPDAGAIASDCTLDVGRPRCRIAASTGSRASPQRAALRRLRPAGQRRRLEHGGHRVVAQCVRALQRDPISPPAAQTRTTVMSPEVSVRVLSVQMTVVDPSDSTAGSRRTSACRAAMRRTPTASAIVATAGRASGTAATASAMPVSSTSAERRALPGAEAGDERRDAERQPDQSPSERVEPALERRALDIDGADERADAADLRRRRQSPSRPHGRGRRRPSCPCRPCCGDRRAACRRPEPRAARLRHRQRLAGQRRLVIRRSVA